MQYQKVSNDLDDFEIRFVKHYKRLGFGELSDIEIQNGRPLLAGLSTKHYVFKKDSNNDGYSFFIAEEDLSLIKFIRKMANGTINKIIIRNGVPVGCHYGTKDIKFDN